MNKKIYYDANFAINEHRGMGKYINNFVDVLKKCAGKQPVGLLKSNAIHNDSFHSFGMSNYVLWEQFSLPSYLKKNHGITIFPYNTAPLCTKKDKKNVLILHDLIYMDNFEATSIKQRIGAFYRRFLVPKIISNFDKIITVSEFSKTEIVSRFNINPSSIKVIYNSIDFDIFDSENNVKIYDREKYIFHIGGEPAYKNSKAVLYAFAKLPDVIKNTYKLKLVGIRNEGNRREYLLLAKSLGIADKLELLNYQSDEEIAQLYRKASLFIFPSFSEGFGIPIIEAFKYGCPLICSDTSCFPEIAGDGAFYFNPSDVDSITYAMESLLTDPVKSNQKVENGYIQIQKFTAKSFTENVMNWYMENFTEKI